MNTNSIQTYVYYQCLVEDLGIRVFKEKFGFAPKYVQLIWKDRACTIVPERKEEVENK